MSKLWNLIMVHVELMERHHHHNHRHESVTGMKMFDDDRINVGKTLSLDPYKNSHMESMKQCRWSTPQIPNHENVVALAVTFVLLNRKQDLWISPHVVARMNAKCIFKFQYVSCSSIVLGVANLFTWLSVRCPMAYPHTIFNICITTIRIESFFFYAHSKIERGFFPAHFCYK